MPDDQAPPDVGIGHNAPPLAETLSEESKPLRDRAQALIANVAASRIDSPETAEAVTTLAGMLADVRTKAETARKAAAEPFDAGKAAVQAAYARGIIDPLDAALTTCRKMLDAWRSHLAQQAQAEAAKRAAEAAEARRLAEEAESKKIELESAGDTAGALAAELRQLQAEETAEKLASDEGTIIRPDAMIRTQVGSAASTTTRVPTVTNIGLVLRYLMTEQGTSLIEAITPIIARLTRAKVTIPGVEVKEVSATRFRR